MITVHTGEGERERTDFCQESNSGIATGKVQYQAAIIIYHSRTKRSSPYTCTF